MRKHTRSAEKHPMETIGIDLGDKMSRYCIVNRDGEVVEEGSFRNQVSSIEAHFSGGRSAKARCVA
jgi:activator of 2-hydroxyglutaryl-CoA dehydratase